ncbi:MAG: glycoside hydrolase family 3 C-terminal domain-containing protein [Gemmatimonadetes bacterium]|nr:glycoside hydrolase family 3 C-terminal domain-containing protein [Gemmatimonadota bacterium]
MTFQSIPRLPNSNPAGSFWILALLFSACSQQGLTTASVPPPEPPAEVVEAEGGPSAGLPQEPAPEPVAPAQVTPAPRTPPLTWAERTLAGMTLREKVGQLMMPFVLGNFAPEGSETHDRIVDVIEQENVGGLIMSVGSPTEVAVKLNDLQDHSKYPLLVAADLETGAGFRFRGAVHIPTNIALGGATTFPSLMAFGATGDPRHAYQMGKVTALEARAMGVHVPFAPVLDVNNNPDNPIINIRSFGEDPQVVADMGVALVRGLQDFGAVATGKHFPGHGDTGTDSHLELPIIQVGRERLDAVELVPFRAAIEAGVKGIMTAHIAVPAISGDTIPATVSRRVLTGLLRNELGFDGIIFTDAMDMLAVSRLFPRGEAAVRAVLAGADVILMPSNVKRAIDAIVSAIDAGRLTEARIDESVGRLLRLKEELGLAEERSVPLEMIPRVVGVPLHMEMAREVAERSITLIKNQRNLLPLLGTRRARVMSVSFRNPGDVLSGRYFDSRLRETYPRLVSRSVDESTNSEGYSDLLRRAGRSDLVVVSVYSNFAGRVDLPDATVDFVNELARRRVTHVVISFGTPYLISLFPDARVYLLAWSSAQVSQQAAADALFGDIAITGRSPTGMAPFFAVGDGIQIPLSLRVSGG